MSYLYIDFNTAMNCYTIPDILMKYLKKKKRRPNFTIKPTITIKFTKNHPK